MDPKLYCTFHSITRSLTGLFFLSTYCLLALKPSKTCWPSLCKPLSIIITIKITATGGTLDTTQPGNEGL